MTIAELLSIPKGMKIDEYEEMLKRKKKLEKQIEKASSDIDFENDSLEILASEKGSERYNKHLQDKRKAEEKVLKAQIKLNAIMKILNK